MDSRDKSRSIVLSARARFRHYGIKKTSMQEIAQDAGLAVGTLYLYFKNKDEIVVACAEEFAENHQAFAQDLLSSSYPADEKLRIYILNRFHAVEDTRASRHAAEIASSVIRLHPERFDEDEKWMQQTILSILNEGQDKGVFQLSDPARDAEVFFHSIKYFLPVAGMEPYRQPREEELSKVTDWFIDHWTMPGRKPARAQAPNDVSRRKEEMRYERSLQTRRRDVDKSRQRATEGDTGAKR